MHRLVPASLIVVVVVVALAAAILLAAFSLPAVLPANAQTPAGNAVSPSGQSVPVLRTNSFTVLLDVVVTDSNAAIHGIDPRSFASARLSRAQHGRSDARREIWVRG